MHRHEAAFDPSALILGAAFVAGVAAYLVGVAAAGRRGRAWPAWRTVCAVAGGAVALVAVGPLPAAAGHGFVAHMWGHLLLGMLAPLLVVVAAPGTLALRALPARPARRVARLLGGRFVATVTDPMVAAVLDVGGLWLLYGTGLYPAMHHHPWLALLVHTHVFLSGLAFTAAILRVDPDRHPVAPGWRAVVLVAFLTAHGLLAKHLYAHPPAGVPVADAQAGAQLMYYGGDVVDLALITLFCLDVYRRTAPTRASPRRGTRLRAAHPRNPRDAGGRLAADG